MGDLTIDELTQTSSPRSDFRMRFARLLFLYSLASFAALASAAAKAPSSAAWPSFQKGGDPSVADDNLPLHWKPGEGIAWQVELQGYGQSSPVVAGQQVFVTSTSGPNKETCHLAAFQLSDGEKRWQLDLANPSPEESTNYVSKAAPTPAVDQERLIALFEGGLLLATDFTGQILWQRNLVEDYGPLAARHGLGSSLEQDEQRVFVWLERTEQPYLLAVDKETGKSIWKVEGMGATSWSSPRLVAVGDGAHLVCSASGRVSGFDPATGVRLWELDGVANNTTATPFPLTDGRFLLGASEGRGEEAGGNGAQSNGVIQIRRREDGSYTAEFIWRARRATSSFGSPVVADQLAYLVNRAGVLYGLDVATGEERYVSRLGAGSIWATPLITPNRLYFFGREGTTSVVARGDRFEELATNPLWEGSADRQPAEEAALGTGGPVLYAAVAAAPYLILRSGDTLHAIQTDNGE
jgi:outer membrane protein assembly factor BamB